MRTFSQFRTFAKPSFCLTALLALAFTAAAQSSDKPLINVTGSAEVKVAPDQVQISVGVETRDENLAEAKHQNDERVARALHFLKDKGVEDKDVQSDYVQIEPYYQVDDRSSLASHTKPLFYIVRKSIGINLRNPAIFDTVLTGLIDNGVNNIHDIQFRTSELRKYRDQARQMAVHAAREKADALAAELGVKAGKPQSINAREWGGWMSYAGRNWGGFGGGFGGANAMYQNVSQNAGGGESAEGTLAVGQISVSATVDVSFLIQ